MSLPILRGPLAYLIGADADHMPPCGDAGTIVEVPYDYLDHHKSLSGRTQYGNLRDEEKTGKFGPYLPGDDITDEYGEYTPNPKFRGFMENVRLQVERAIEFRAGRIEFDNPDSKGLPLSAVMRAHDLAWAKRLRTVAKNPLLVSDPGAYISHASVDLCIVERGAKGSDAMDELRRNVGQPSLAVRFVAYADGDGGEDWARVVAENIKFKHYANMGVTYSRGDEYSQVEHVLVPK